MTDSDPVEQMRQVAREVLRELVPGDARGAPRAAWQLRSTATADTPRTSSRWFRRRRSPPSCDRRPGPLRPGRAKSSVNARRPWRRPWTNSSDGSVEAVTIDTDDDLQRFVGALISRLESPRERRAIRAGRLRFTLQRSPEGMPGTGTIHNRAATATVRISKGAVTERAVREAAAKGARLVLARGAVLTPLARDQVRALGVEIEREGKC